MEKPPEPDLTQFRHLQGNRKGAHTCTFGGPNAGCYFKNILPVSSLCPAHQEIEDQRRSRAQQKDA